MSRLIFDQSLSLVGCSQALKPGCRAAIGWFQAAVDLLRVVIAALKAFLRTTVASYVKGRR